MPEKKIVQVSFPRSYIGKNIISSFNVRFGSLKEQGHIQSIPKMSSKPGTLKGFSTVVIECDDVDHPVIFGMYLGIDLARNNLETLFNVDLSSEDDEIMANQ